MQPRTERPLSPSGYTGFNDKSGVPIRVGDSGKYVFMEFHVIRRGRGFFLEKWCKIYDVPLNKESAGRYVVTIRKE